MNKQQIAQRALDIWFKTHDTVTTLDLKNYLINTDITEYWSQQWVSAFMMDQDLDYVVETNSNGDEYRVYASPNLKVNPDLSNLQDIVAALLTQGIDITKNKIKACLTASSYSLDNFKDLFKQLNLQHDGKTYNAENHKIWTYVPQGQHLSKTKGTLVDIKTMPKPYLLNAICKEVSLYDGEDVAELIKLKDSELSNLLRAYFTYDLRQTLNSL